MNSTARLPISFKVASCGTTDNINIDVLREDRAGDPVSFRLLGVAEQEVLNRPTLELTQGEAFALRGGLVNALKDAAFKELVR